jgi:hypothetical protein
VYTNEDSLFQSQIEIQLRWKFYLKHNWNTIETESEKAKPKLNIKSKIDLIKWCNVTFCQQMKKNGTFYELLKRLIYYRL